MHDNTPSEIADPGLDDAFVVAIQAALVGIVFMFAISGTAAIIFSLGAAM